MRVLVTSNMGWLAVPLIALVGIAYIWIVSKLLPYEQPTAESRRVSRAA